MVTSDVLPDISSPEFVWSALPRVALLANVVLVTVPVLFTMVMPGIALAGKIWLPEMLKLEPDAIPLITMPSDFITVEPDKVKLGGARASMQDPDVAVLFKNVLPATATLDRPWA